MHIKEGIIPAVLGTCVTATGIALKNSGLPESYRSGIIGFGLAHIVLGSVEMVNHDHHTNHQHDDIVKRLAKNFK